MFVLQGPRLGPRRIQRRTCGAIGQRKRGWLVQSSRSSGTTRANFYPPHRLVRTRHEFILEKITTECNAVLVIGVQTPNCSNSDFSGNTEQVSDPAMHF